MCVFNLKLENPTSNNKDSRKAAEFYCILTLKLAAAKHIMKENKQDSFITSSTIPNNHKLEARIINGLLIRQSLPERRG